MAKEIKFSLVYRDMWQSSGKYVPRKDQLAKIAPVIIDMGCFDRVETNGGASEQVNLLYGENPNQAVRTISGPYLISPCRSSILCGLQKRRELLSRFSAYRFICFTPRPA